MAEIRVIYIASTGRSGSTVLELLLNSMEGMWSTGEIYALPWEIRLNRLCGCGKPIRQCPFWGPYVPALKDSFRGNRPWLAYFRDSEVGGRFFRPLQLINILFGGKWFIKDKNVYFCNENYTVFYDIFQRARREKKVLKYLLDSSKDFYRLHWLSMCEKIDLKVIHIVKDPRAYVYSTLKRYEEYTWKRRAACVRMSIKYILENAIISHINRGLPSRAVRLIRYEDLAANPVKLIKNIARWLGLPYDPEIILNFRSVPNHGIAGNIARHKKTDIFLDNTWRKNLEPCFEKIIMGITWPIARQYGYFV